MSVKLLGHPISNYYNVVKLCLLEKGIEFEEVPQRPEKEEAYLAKSPMGKIPCLQVGDQYLSETLAILTFLERHKAEPALLPSDAMTAGRAMQIYQMIDHYIDPCGRNLLGMTFFGAPREQEKVDQQLEKLEFAVKALARVVRFDPFIAGSELTFADLNAAVTLSYVGLVMKMQAQRNPLMEIDGMKAYVEMLAERPHFQKVYADRDAGLKQMMGQ